MIHYFAITVFCYVVAISNTPTAHIAPMQVLYYILCFIRALPVNAIKI